MRLYRSRPSGGQRRDQYCGDAPRHTADDLERHDAQARNFPQGYVTGALVRERPRPALRRHIPDPDVGDEVTEMKSDLSEILRHVRRQEPPIQSGSPNHWLTSVGRGHFPSNLNWNTGSPSTSLCRSESRRRTSRCVKGGSVYLISGMTMVVQPRLLLRVTRGLAPRLAVKVPVYLPLLFDSVPSSAPVLAL